jgi:Domain of Unknown Function (DUF928)
MMAIKVLTGLLGAALVAALVGPTPSLGQTGQAQTFAQQEGAQAPEYKPPPRGAPGGRVGGASRGTYKPTASLPTVELLAPNEITGLSASPTPNLYFYVSGPVLWPTQFTISAPMQPVPVIEANIPPPSAAGVYALHLADYRIRLAPGVVYTWSVSAILDPNARSRDIVASATLLLGAPDAAVETAARTAPPARRAALYAQAGFWYDAVAAAAEAAPYDGYAALDALMNEVGLAEPGYGRRVAGDAAAR